jgi:LPXTG-site transpeptidase (sortase) family protein
VRVTALSRRNLVLGAGVSAAVVALGAAPARAAEPSLGTIRIPAINVTKKLYSGTSKRVLARGGFGHWIYTAKPGALGHCTLFAHRTSAGGPMRKAHLLTPGDIIEIGTVTYTVTAKEVVHRSQAHLGLLHQGPPSTRTLALVACSKANGLPTSLKYRIIIRAVA